MALGAFPLLFSKFIIAFSLWSVLDPVAILIVDSALLRFENSASQPIGDAFKLYWHFLRVEGNISCAYQRVNLLNLVPLRLVIH